MKPNDPQRFARELHGDFSEVDAFLRAERIKMGWTLVGLVFAAALYFWFW